MRKFIAIVSVFIISSGAFANEKQNQLFDCMDKQTFEVNSQCMESRISQNMQFRTMQSDIAVKTQMMGENAVATIKMYPQDKLIQVVAHRDALLTASTN